MIPEEIVKKTLSSERLKTQENGLIDKNFENSDSRLRRLHSDKVEFSCIEEHKEVLKDTSIDASILQKTASVLIHFLWKNFLH